MADKTKIEWTRGDDGSPGATWNPLVGCTKVSPGCDHCYAEGVVTRWHAAGKPAFPAPFGTVSLRHGRLLTQPLHWTEPRRIFVNSLSDLFHADVPTNFIATVFAIMALAPQHTFQLLTKRHGRMRALLSDAHFVVEAAVNSFELRAPHTGGYLGAVTVDEAVRRMQRDWPLPNLWLGVSVEDQHWADIRIPALLDTPAAIRWISAEPLLGPLCLCDYLRSDRRAGVRLDWVVTGGESGSGARPMHPRWAIDVAHDCADHGVAFLHKQNGAHIPDRSGRETAVDTEGREYPGRLRRVGKTRAGRELDGITYDGYPAEVTA